MKRSFAATKDEQKIIENILSGMRPMSAIPRDVAVRIDSVDRFAKLADDFENLRRVEEAVKLQELAKSKGIALSITNNFGLDIFDGKSFSRNAAKSKSSKEALEEQIDKQIEELIESMREAKFNTIKDISDTQKRLEKMRKEFDDYDNNPNSTNKPNTNKPNTNKPNTNKPNNRTTSQDDEDDESPRYARAVQMRFDVSNSRKASKMTYGPWNSSVQVTYKDGRTRTFIDVPYEKAKQAGASGMIDEFITDMESGKIGTEDKE